MSKYETMKQAEQWANESYMKYKICSHCIDMALACHYHVEAVKGEWPITNTVNHCVELHSKYLNKHRIVWKYYMECFEEWLDDNRV